VGTPFTQTLIVYVMNTLIIGYGNPYRQDDGVAWHILREVGKKLGLPDEETITGFLPASQEIDLWCVLQIIPEMADTIAKYDRVCFVDAHTGIVPEEVAVKPVLPVYTSSPLTHHLTPESLLSITHTIYHVEPEALLISVRGYEFGFSEDLSKHTMSLVPIATSKIMSFISP